MQFLLNLFFINCDRKKYENTQTLVMVLFKWRINFFLCRNKRLFQYQETYHLFYL